jgi:hypothetical protein
MVRVAAGLHVLTQQGQILEQILHPLPAAMPAHHLQADDLNPPGWASPSNRDERNAALALHADSVRPYTAVYGPPSQ